MTTGMSTSEHNEETCVDCLDSQLFAARSTIDVLVTALRDCVQSLKRLPDVDGAYRVTAIKQAEQALETMSSDD